MTEVVVEETDSTKVWHKTACVLCSNNCGIEVRLDGREITRVRGDKILYCGGGQGNHLPGAYARGLMQTLGMKFRQLATEEPGAVDDRYPFILSAGERRSSNANDINRDWLSLTPFHKHVRVHLSAVG